MPGLTLGDLQASSQKMRDVQHDTCRMVLASCQDHIKAINATGQTSVVYQIPGMVEGRPAMSSRKIALYVQDRLLKGGISVRLLSDNLVYIDWTPIPEMPVGNSQPGERTQPSVRSAKAKPPTDTDESHKLRRRLLNFRRRAEGWIKT